MTLPRGVRGLPRRRFGGRLALRLLFVALAVVFTAVTTPAAAASTQGYAGWSGAPSSAGDVAPTLSPPAGIGTAAATDGSVLALASISPAIAGPGVPVTVTGTVTARQQALADASVRIVVGSTPIVSRASVAAWATSTGSLTGQEVGSTTLGAQVAPGASMPFTVTVPGGRLSLNRAFGVIPVAVQVRDTSSGATETLRTFVGWQRIKQYEPMRLAVVAPVTLSPDAALFDAQESSRTAAWQTELAPTGRINRILDGTDVTGPAGIVPVTWAVDPAVLRLAPGAGSDPLAPVVAPLVSRLQAAAGKHPLWALPYADPDLAATVAASPRDPTLGREIRDSTMLGQGLGVPVTTGVAWPADGSIAAPREEALRTAYQEVGLTAVLGSSSALPVTSGFTGQAPRRTASGTTVLAWDDELSRLASRTTTPAEGALATGRFLAETAAILGERPGVVRTFLVALPRSIDPDPGTLRQLLGTLAQTPWIQLVSTDDLQQQAATQDPVASLGTGTWDLAGPAQINGARLAKIAVERKAVDEVATILGGAGVAYRSQWNTMLDQLTSTRWRSAPAQFATLDAAVSQAVSQATSGVRISDQTTNFLADEGTLQVTVVNDLGVQVDGVRLVLTPTNPRLRIVAQADPVSIAAGSRAVVRVRAQALAAGLVPVNATLTTRDGTTIGRPGTITVRANPPGYTFYIVGGGVAAVILLVGIIRTLRRRPAVGEPAGPAHDERDERTPVPPDPDDTAPLAPDDPAVRGASGERAASDARNRAPRRMAEDRT